MLAMPNLQNIPTRSELGKKLRREFFSPPTSLVEADYSELERWLANYVKM